MEGGSSQRAGRPRPERNAARGRAPSEAGTSGPRTARLASSRQPQSTRRPLRRARGPDRARQSPQGPALSVRVAPSAAGLPRGTAARDRRPPNKCSSRSWRADWSNWKRGSNSSKKSSGAASTSPSSTSGPTRRLPPSRIAPRVWKKGTDFSAGNRKLAEKSPEIAVQPAALIW